MACHGLHASRVTINRSPTKYLPVCSRKRVRSWSWVTSGETLPKNEEKDEEKETTQTVAKLFKLHVKATRKYSI